MLFPENAIQNLGKKIILKWQSLIGAVEAGQETEDEKRQCCLWPHCSPAVECHLALLTARHLADRDEVIISCHQYSQLHTMTTEISFPVIMNRMTIPQVRLTYNIIIPVLTKYQPHVLLAECFTAPAPVPLCCSSSAHAWGPAHCLH